MIGVDFDNTIVCYDGVFQAAAAERELVEGEQLTSKEQLRDVLRRSGREELWTELQGHVYGPGMAQARPFPGALEFLEACVRSGHAVSIISHRTPYPYRGPRHDLHAYARAWLHDQGITDPERVGLPEARVHFEETKAAKLRRIAACHCAVFIDDLPEFLTDPGFPQAVERVLFDPHGSEAALASGLRRLPAWGDARFVLEDAAR